MENTKLVAPIQSQLIIYKTMGFFNRMFGNGKKQEIISEKKAEESPDNEFTEEQFDEDYELKAEALESILGKMHNMVGHAIIPFSIGGAVDMYYFPNHIEGTGFATMELLDPAGYGPKPNRLGTYELVAFTKELYNTSEDTQTPFNLIERRMCGIFTAIGNFSTNAVLNPGDTCEVPKDGEENRCLIFDSYNPGNTMFKIGDRMHHLLLCMEIFRSEMYYSRAKGSDKLLELLKHNCIYPYSDLDREPVV